MKKDNLKSKEQVKQGNWNISDNHPTEGETEQRISPKELGRKHKKEEAKSKIDEEGYVKSLGYQDIPPEGNDPAKNEQMKAPEDERKKIISRFID